MEAHVYEYKKIFHYDRKGYNTWNKSTLCFDKNLKHPPSKVGSRYEIFAQKDITKIGSFIIRKYLLCLELNLKAE